MAGSSFMGMSPTGLGGMLGLALSGGLHLLAAMVVPRAPADVSAVPVSFSELRFESLPVEDEPPPVEPALDQTPPPTPPHVPLRRVRRRRALRPEPQPAAPPEVTPARPDLPDAPVAPSPVHPPQIALDPHSVARAGFTPGRPAAHAARSSASTDDTGREAAERRLDAHLALANHAPAEGRRAPPRLLRRSDGGYLWRGPGFRARIDRTGDVTFSDQPSFRYDGENAGASALPSASFRFDITDALERRHGNDPYYADRRWFMGQTRALRAELAERAHSEQVTREDRRLLGRLRRLAQDLTSSLSERHRAVYQVWRDCAEDEVGRHARDRVERFVREEMPEGGEDAFAVDELRVLNTGSSAPFAPYAR